MSLPLFAYALLSGLAAQDSVDYRRDVLPILSGRCFECHGPDAAARKAGLRLDRPDGLRKANANGQRILSPGKPEESLLLRRVHGTARDGDKVLDRMPPSKSGPALTPAEKATLIRWIREGARWAPHWAFECPQRPKLPASPETASAIDRLVRRRLASRGVTPSPRADRRTLARRVTLDLTGLPPTKKEVEDFVGDRRTDAYARLVDRLLASPAFGERMAFVWLDAARYSDTDGYQQDAVRENWPWRDWVVDAYNSGMRFDRFTREQFAGDLLPKPTPESRLATCFHRNHMTNGEGGRDPAESRVDYVIDRVNTVGTVWLGLTVSCAQCHDHKYDPISQKDYYALSAFFNSIDEDGRAGRSAKPYLSYKSKRIRPGLEASDRWLKAERTRLQKIERAAEPGFREWLEDLVTAQGKSKVPARSYVPGRPIRLESRNGAKLRDAGDGRIVASGPNSRHEDYVLRYRPELPQVTGMRLSIYPITTNGGPRLSLAKDGHALPTNLKLYVKRRGSSAVRELRVRRALADHEWKNRGEVYGPVRTLLDDDPRSGWWTKGRPVHESRHAVFALAEPLVLSEDETLVLDIRHRSVFGFANLRNFRIRFTGELGPATETLGPTPREALAFRGALADLHKTERDALRAEHFADHHVLNRARDDVGAAQRQRDGYARLTKQAPRVMVLAERKKRRKTHILVRGEWNKRGARVTAGVPESLRNAEDGPHTTRLDLADWITDARNPLTSRVAVNRYWQMLFGHGLVRTPEDFGVRGEQPVHADVLDWLSVEFVESGWNVKHVIRTIVLSETYCQSSVAREDLRERDPENTLLARQNRYRLPSSMIRDAALAASDLLVRRIGGPPVFPPQPDGVWADSTMGRLRYRPSVGEDRYRRSLYSFWRRLSAPTVLFDSPKRRVCRVRAVRTNTPTQALTLMNDPAFLDASLNLARLALRTRGAKDAGRIDEILLRVLARRADAFERTALSRRLDEFRRLYRASPDEARALTARTLSGRGAPTTAPPAELAAWTMLASLILNLDEAIVRQ